jgi:hypothetical protein
MFQTSIEKAKDRLASAKLRIKDLESAKSYEKSRQNWYEFLISSNAVFSILEQGSKGGGIVFQNWYIEKKKEQKTDPLLCYLHHARNADEHNIQSVTEIDLQKVVMVENGKPVAEMRRSVNKKGIFHPVKEFTSTQISRINEIRIYPDRARLISVVDRGVNYDPPEKHLGSPMDDNGPIAVANLMVQYLERLIAEAMSLMRRN